MYDFVFKKYAFWGPEKEYHVLCPRSCDWLQQWQEQKWEMERGKEGKNQKIGR